MNEFRNTSRATWKKFKRFRSIQSKHWIHCTPKRNLQNDSLKTSISLRRVLYWALNRVPFRVQTRSWRTLSSLVSGSTALLTTDFSSASSTHETPSQTSTNWHPGRATRDSSSLLVLMNGHQHRCRQRRRRQLLLTTPLDNFQNHLLCRKVKFLHSSVQSFQLSSPRKKMRKEVKSMKRATTPSWLVNQRWIRD